MIGIYAIISPSNRVYVGQAVDIKRRWNEYKNLNNCKNQKRLYRSFMKYGVEEHTFQIMEECPVEELNNREGHWQDFFDCVHNGLNCRRVKTDDKSGYASEETKIRQSLAKKGESHHNYGKKLPSHIAEALLKSNIGRKNTPEQSAAQSERMKGEKNHNYGKKIHPNAYNAMLKANKERIRTEEEIKNHLESIQRGNNHHAFGKPRPENTCYKIREANTDNPKLCKIVLDTQTGVFYYSIKEAAKAYNMTANKLSSYLNGYAKNKTNLIKA